MVWLITGAGGQLGSVLLRQLAFAHERAVGVTSPGGPTPTHGSCVSADLTDEALVASVLARVRPATVVHCAAVSRVAAAHADPAAALRVNAESTRLLSRFASESRARFVYVSTDMVFDGTRAPYSELSEPSPLSAYGRTKLEGERAAATNPDALVVRLPLLYGLPAVDRDSPFAAQVAALRSGTELRLFQDEFRTPLWLEDAAASIAFAARSDVRGLLHLGGPDRLSRLEMGSLLAEALGIANPAIRAVEQKDVPAPEPRAADLSLDSRAFERVFGERPGRPMRDALARMDFG